jgi:hypothetical protein
MPKTVYIETSIISYLTAQPSRDLRAAAWQQITTQWWQQERAKYELYTSALVMREASQGDAEAAERRLQVLASLSGNGTVPGTFSQGIAGCQVLFSSRSTGWFTSFTV